MKKSYSKFFTLLPTNFLMPSCKGFVERKFLYDEEKNYTYPYLLHIKLFGLDSKQNDLYFRSKVAILNKII